MALTASQLTSPRRDAARGRLEVELDRVLAAVRAGMDPDLAARETKSIQTELGAAAAAITHWEQSQDRVVPLTDGQLRGTLTEAGNRAGLLRGADRVDRAALYQALGTPSATKEKLQPDWRRSRSGWS
jgi:hypothetical protein